MNTENVNNRTFEIMDRLKEGASTMLILKEFTEKWQCSARTVYREMKFARNLLVNMTRDRELMLAAAQKEAKPAEPGNGQLNAAIVLDVLYDIITGKCTNEKLVRLPNGKTRIELEKLPASNRITAIKTWICVEKEMKAAENPSPWAKAEQNFADSRQPNDNYSPGTGRLNVIVSNESEKRAIEKI